MQKKKRKTKVAPLNEQQAKSMIQKKLVCLYIVVILALMYLCGRIIYINVIEGYDYKKQVLTQSQQRYGSTIIPYQRGDILDRNGTVLATSEKVYNVILDCKLVNTNKAYIEPTIKALVLSLIHI